jgi:hypothetical protein
MAQAAIATPVTGVNTTTRRSTIGCNRSASHLMPVPHPSSDDADAHRPEELGTVWRGEAWDVRNDQGKLPKSRPSAKTDEDQGPDQSVGFLVFDPRDKWSEPSTPSALRIARSHVESMPGIANERRFRAAGHGAAMAKSGSLNLTFPG